MLTIKYLSNHLMKQRFFLELMYDGTNYHGWQVQPHSPSVQACLELALSTILNEKISVVGAGRTDTGVHARHMVAHFDTNQSIDCVELTYKLNSFLKNDISVSKLYGVKSDVHARFDAISRTYEYHIHFKKNPFLVNKSWYYYRNLNIDLMNEASLILLEYEDFTSFSKLHTQTKTNLCQIQQAHWQSNQHSLAFTIQANRFLRNMVRSIVGTLVEVGEQKASLSDFRTIVESKNRKRAGVSVPAHGLYLSKIIYPETIFNDQ